MALFIVFMAFFRVYLSQPVHNIHPLNDPNSLPAEPLLFLPRTIKHVRSVHVKLFQVLTTSNHAICSPPSQLGRSCIVDIAHISIPNHHPLFFADVRITSINSLVVLS